MEQQVLFAVREKLENDLARYIAGHESEATGGMFSQDLWSGYVGGLKQAIETINYEIGIRQDPPNINYPGEIPTAQAGKTA